MSSLITRKQRLVVVFTLMIDKQERDQHNTGANPIDRAGILITDDHLSDERQWDC